MDARALRFRRGDAVAIGIVLFCALALIALFAVCLGGETECVAQIYLEDALVAELPLDADADYLIDGAYENMVHIRNGRAAIVESNCPGGDCVHCGWVSSAGRSIVCLPNRAEVRIVGVQTTDDVDIIVG